MIQLQDNFNYHQTEYLSFDDKKYKNDKKIIGEKFVILLKDYTNEKYKNNTLFSFFKDEEKKAEKNSDDLIISIKKDGENYLAQTGNYVGKIVWDGLEIDIRSRFSDVFLQRMLNFANDVFLDDVSVFDAKEAKDLDFSKYIIYYMFVQNLEKAFLLGLPKAYRSIEYHEIKLKGKIDINRFIKSDIPFQGKISSTNREQKEIQEIIDTLYKAVKIIEKSGKDFTKNISHVKTHLKQHRSKKYVSNETINKALKSKALQNPIFAPYKKVLKYAKFIINGNNFEEKKEGNEQTYGFLVNVAEIFEIYVTKLLQKEFSDWHVESPKIPLYENQFFARKIIPDIVMTKDKNVMVFDTKYKKMMMRGTKENIWDVDRADFFQINTYMSCYKNSDYQVMAGGLLYPMEAKFDKAKCYSENWLGDKDTKFIVDGIDLIRVKENSKIKDLVKSETALIERIKELMQPRNEIS